MSSQYEITGRIITLYVLRLHVFTQKTGRQKKDCKLNSINHLQNLISY
jgi:hypothetical protein